MIDHARICADIRIFVRTRCEACKDCEGNTCPFRVIRNLLGGEPVRRCPSCGTPMEGDPDDDEPCMQCADAPDECLVCGGEGSINDQSCAACGGTGVNEKEDTPFVEALARAVDAALAETEPTEKDTPK